MSVIDDAVDETTESREAAATPAGAPSPDRPADRPTIKLRNKKHRNGENGKLRPTSIHIFEDLEKNGVIPEKALSSYKTLARSQRMSRTMQALYSIDSNVAKDMFDSKGPALPRGGGHQNRPASMFDVSSRPSPSPTGGPTASATNDDDDDGGGFDAGRSSPRMAAALTIQRHFRGLLGRRRYAGRLWEVYAEEEEKQRAERERDLVEETEILVEARKALIDMEELETVKRNAKRLLVSRVVTIQRAWRSHRARVVRDMPHLAHSRLAREGGGGGGGGGGFGGGAAAAAGTVQLPPPPSSISCDSIADRAMSLDGDAGISVVGRESASSLRSTNAVLTTTTTSSKKPGGGGGGGGFDREAIRLQLAMEDEDVDARIVVVDVVGASRRRRFSDDAFLEVTLNDIPEDAEAETATVVTGVVIPGGGGAAGVTVDGVAAENAIVDDAVETILEADDASACAASSSSSSFKEPLPQPRNAFDDACERLRQETEMQLAQSPALAQLQMELEKHEKDEPPSIVDSFKQLRNMVKESGIDEAEIGNLNVAGLQVLVNDLLSRVETNNEELMALLQERDRLHMEQDSMLVDIEDLIKQCKRQAELNNRRGIPR